MAVDVYVSEDIPADCTVVEAFPSKGYVSTLAANHMIKKLDMDLIGYIESDKLDSIAVVHENKPLHPVRIYRKDQIIVIFSELIVPFHLVHDFTSSIIDWFMDIKPKNVILLASVPGVETKKEHEILAVSSDAEVTKKLKKLKIKQMKEGVLTGMSSSLLIKCCNYQIPATSLMVETKYIPDVLASASLLKIIRQILPIQFEIDELTKTGEEIEKKLKDTLKQLRKGTEDYKQINQELSMYR